MEKTKNIFKTRPSMCVPFIAVIMVFITSSAAYSADNQESSGFDAWWVCKKVNTRTIVLSLPVRAWNIRGNSFVYISDNNNRDDIDAWPTLFNFYHRDLTNTEEKSDDVHTIQQSATPLFALCSNKIVYKDDKKVLNIIDIQNGDIANILKKKNADVAEVLAFSCHSTLPLCASIGVGDRFLRIHNVDTGDVKAEISTTKHLKPQEEPTYFITWHPTNSLVTVAYKSGLLLYNLKEKKVWAKEKFSGIPRFSYNNNGWYIFGETHGALLRVSCDCPTQEMEVIQKDLNNRRVLSIGNNHILTENSKSGEIVLESIHDNTSKKTVDVFNNTDQTYERQFPSYANNRFITVKDRILTIYTPST